MKLEELQKYSMIGKTFTIVDKQNKKKTIEVGSDYPFTLEVIATQETNLCSRYITILPSKTDTPYIYEIEEILESQSCVLVLIYQVNIGGQKWLEASTLEDLLEDVSSTDCLFIPDKELKDNEWCSYAGSDTFDTLGTKVLKWKYAKDCLEKVL